MNAPRQTRMLSTETRKLVSTLPSISKTRTALLLAALVPFLVAVGVQIKGASVNQFASTKPLEPLVFSQYLVNLGPIPPGERYASAYFIFKNNGSSKITLKSPVPSCSCIHPRLDEEQRDYAPGELGRLFVALETAKEPPGPRQYSITIPYEVAGEKPVADQPRVREIELMFKVTLPESDVVVQPRGIAVIHSQKQETTRTVKVLDRRPVPLEVTGVDTTSPRIVARVVGTGQSEGGYRATEIEIIAKGALPGQTMHETVTIRTNDAKYRTLSVPVMVSEPRWQQSELPPEHRSDGAVRR